MLSPFNDSFLISVLLLLLLCRLIVLYLSIQLLHCVAASVLLLKLLTYLLTYFTYGVLEKLVMCELDVSESPMALNGLISVPSEGNKQLPTEVSEELASIQDAGIKILMLTTTQ